MNKGNYMTGSQKLLTALELSVQLKNNSSKASKTKKHKQVTELIITEFDTNEYDVKENNGGQHIKQLVKIEKEELNEKQRKVIKMKTNRQHY